MELTQDLLHFALRDFVRAMVENKIAPTDALSDLNLHEVGVTDWIGEWLKKTESDASVPEIRYWFCEQLPEELVPCVDALQIELWSEGHFVCEFQIAWVQLGEPTARVRLFSDAWEALRLHPALFSSLLEAAQENRTSPDDIKARLLALGAQPVEERSSGPS